MKIRFDGRVALVTGGARRMGRAFVEALAGRGMREGDRSPGFIFATQHREPAVGHLVIATHRHHFGERQCGLTDPELDRSPTPGPVAQHGGGHDPQTHGHADQVGRALPAGQVARGVVPEGPLKGNGLVNAVEPLAEVDQDGAVR